MANRAIPTGVTTRCSYNFVPNRADAPVHQRTVASLILPERAALPGGHRFRPLGPSVDHMPREGLAMYAGALALGMEGNVAKDATSQIGRAHV